MKNLLTDIPGVRVGHADDATLASGVTAVVFDTPAVAAMDVRGGGPGTRDSALLDPVNTVERIDALALSGGSAFGIEAGGGIQAWLAEQGDPFAWARACTDQRHLATADDPAAAPLALAASLGAQIEVTGRAAVRATIDAALAAVPATRARDAVAAELRAMEAMYG